MSLGSCEEHGGWKVDGQETCPSCEISRLRAELERLQYINAGLLKEKDGIDKDLFEMVCFERDEALDALSSAQKDLTCGQHDGYKMVWCNECIKIEREAQAAVLAQEVQKAAWVRRVQDYLR